MILTKQLLEKILIQAIITEGNNGIASKALEALQKGKLQIKDINDCDK